VEFGFDVIQEQRPRHLPRLIEANYLLHLSAQELQALIATELADNPALELDEDVLCPNCGMPLEGGACPNCVVIDPAAPTLIQADDVDWSEVSNTSASGESDLDPMALITDGRDDRASLVVDLRAILPESSELLAEVLVESLDERGFMTISLEEIARIAGVSPKDAEEGLAVLREIAPPGVGAMNLRDSLLLQLAYLRDHEVEIPELVEPLVSDHLSDLAAHRYHLLARTFRVGADDISDAHDFVRSHLSPQPWQSQDLTGVRSISDITYVRPDVQVRLNDDNEIVVQVTGSADRALRINELYRDLAVSMRAAAKNDAGTLETDEEKTHVRDAVTRARQFMGKLNQRRETLERISLCAVTMQEDFIREGVRELRPLTRADVAQQVGIHESTVSRATAGKFVMLPNHKVVPFGDFFTASLGAKDAIRELIEKEAAEGRTLSDREIGQRLLEQGYRVARRTVAKYRAELGILPSRIRP
jgi:RNA polymerase sigma-54 factor